MGKSSALLLDHRHSCPQGAGRCSVQDHQGRLPPTSSIVSGAAKGESFPKLLAGGKPYVLSCAEMAPAGGNPTVGPLIAYHRAWPFPNPILGVLRLPEKVDDIADTQSARGCTTPLKQSSPQPLLTLTAKERGFRRTPASMFTCPSSIMATWTLGVHKISPVHKKIVHEIGLEHFFRHGLVGVPGSPICSSWENDFGRPYSTWQGLSTTIMLTYGSSA